MKSVRGECRLRHRLHHPWWCNLVLDLVLVGGVEFVPPLRIMSPALGAEELLYWIGNLVAPEVRAATVSSFEPRRLARRC